MKISRLALVLFLLFMGLACSSDPEPWYAGPYVGGGVTKIYYLDKDYFSDSDKIHGSEESVYEDDYVSCNLVNSDDELTLVLQDGFSPSYIRGEMADGRIVFPEQQLMDDNFTTVSGLALVGKTGMTLTLTYVNNSFLNYYKYSRFVLRKL